MWVIGDLAQRDALNLPGDASSTIRAGQWLVTVLSWIDEVAWPGRRAWTRRDRRDVGEQD